MASPDLSPVPKSDPNPNTDLDPNADHDPSPHHTRGMQQSNLALTLTLIILGACPRATATTTATAKLTARPMLTATAMSFSNLRCSIIIAHALFQVHTDLELEGLKRRLVPPPDRV